MVTAMPVASAGITFFLDVGDLSARRDFAIPPDNAAARHRGITEEPNETHDAIHDSTFLRERQQFACRLRALPRDSYIGITSSGIQWFWVPGSGFSVLGSRFGRAMNW